MEYFIQMPEIQTMNIHFIKFAISITAILKCSQFKFNFTVIQAYFSVDWSNTGQL